MPTRAASSHRPRVGRNENRGLGLHCSPQGSLLTRVSVSPPTPTEALWSC